MTKTTGAASKFVILYAHWRSQSFFDEMYTDLYDFCHCIVDRCERIEDSVKGTVKNLPQKLQDIKVACIEVLEKLAKPVGTTAKSDEKESTVRCPVGVCGSCLPVFAWLVGLFSMGPTIRRQ